MYIDIEDAERRTNINIIEKKILTIKSKILVYASCFKLCLKIMIEN